MPPLQLVLRDHGDGSEQLEAVENPNAQEASELELADRSMHVPRLGTEAFIRLVGALVPSGYQVERLELRDSWGQQLDEESATTVADHLRDLLRDGETQVALRYLNQEAEDVFVVAITVSNPNHRRFRLGQRGSITGYNSSPDQLIGALRDAWRKVGLG